MIAVMNDARTIGTISVDQAGLGIVAWDATAPTVHVGLRPVEFRVVAGRIVADLVDSGIAIGTVGVNQTVFGVGASDALAAATVDVGFGSILALISASGIVTNLRETSRVGAVRVN